MASTCCQPPTAIPYKSIFNPDFQSSNPPASSDATALGCAAHLNLSPVNRPGLMSDRRFQGISAASQSLSSGCAVDPSEKAEKSDSDDDDLPSVREIIARSKQVIDLTLDDNDDSDGDNTIETASSLLTYSLHVPPSLLQKSTAHITDDRTTLLAAATPRKRFPWKNVPPWSPLHDRLKQHADLKQDGVTSDDHGWQAQRIVGERQTSSGLEYEVSVQKTLWLPRAMLDTRLVRKYRAEHRAATRVRTRWSSRLQNAGSSVR